MPSLIDLTGKKFGRLTVIGDSGIRKNGTVYWKCRCECGNVKNINGASLRKGNQQSCGCYKGIGNTKHGMSNTRLYRVWSGMITRCENPSNKMYRLYGMAGIKVCSEWHDFQTFAEWALENGYNDELTIERIDSSLDYEPTNCKWADYREQANNRSFCLYFKKDGRTQTLKQWCEELGLDYKLVHNRLHKQGWSFERAISEPVHTEKRNRRNIERN